MTAAEQPRRWPSMVIILLATLVVAGIGGQLTQIDPMTEGGRWYQALNKPWWQPPDWAFPIAWTAIFATVAVAAYRAWWAAPNYVAANGVVVLFVINGLLNILWTALFFTLQHPDWALVENVFLWLSVFILVVYTARFSATASWLLVIYLLWVTFAAYLNWTVVQMNPAFGGA